MKQASTRVKEGGENKDRGYTLAGNKLLKKWPWAQQGRDMATKSSDLSLSLRNPMMEVDNAPSSCPLTCIYAL